MDLSDTPEQQAFRERARAWLRENIPAVGSPGTPGGFEQHRAWERRLYDAGFVGLHWPVTYGGQGADIVTQAIFEEEYLLGAAPERVNVVGHKLMAPTLFAHGTEEQRMRWLPPMLRGEEIWSQGFSEPDAGSDLAGIRARAERDGDHLVINGQKTWTSYGAFADRIFALVRTRPSPPRHEGITFVVVDMRAPGVEARPITQLDGHAGFAEVFFTDVRAPLDDVVGPIDGGWTVAMTTLGAERDGPARPAARYLRDLRDLAAIARRRGLDRDPLVRDRLGALAARAHAYRLHTLHTLTRLARGESLGAEASAQKLMWSELERDIFATGLEIMGPAAEALRDATPDPETWRSRYWYGRAATIYAGTTEIQRTIVAERVLGLPKG